ncbi:MAG: acetate kinase [Candidatus Omnitrophota bacterium]
MKILVINSGSSSIKYKLFRMPGDHLVQKGVIEHIAEPNSGMSDHYTGLKVILSKVDSVDAVGHRVVHGAEKFRRHVLIDPRVVKEIKRCCGIAPLHNPANLAGILACKKLLPGVKQVAVFDTAFHQTLPGYAYMYGLPYVYYKKLRIRKYGFHGTSHEYVAKEAARLLKRPLSRLKIVTCHLGNGCSIACVRQGKSVDTSMGFTPLEGLIMGTRSGDIDPALVTYLMHRMRLDIPRIDQILNKKSGLLGISGISNDMRILEKKALQGNERCNLAIDMFIYRIRKYIGAYTAVMGGLDVLVFTGGIGENQKRIRGKIVRGLFSGLKKKPRILVVPTDEELMIAQKTYKIIK